MSCLSCWPVLSMNTTFVNPFSTNYTSLKKTFHPYFAILFCQEHDIFYNTVGLKSEKKGALSRLSTTQCCFAKLEWHIHPSVFSPKLIIFLYQRNSKNMKNSKHYGLCLLGFHSLGQNLANRQRAKLSLNLSGLLLML